VKVLFICRHIPYRPDSGVTARIYNLLVSLSGVSDVACAFIVDRDAGNEPALQECRLNVTNYLIETDKSDLSPLRYIFHLLDIFFIPGKVRKALTAIIEREKPDVVWLEFGYLCHLVPFARKFGLPVIYGSHNSQFRLDFALWKSNPSLSYRLKMALFVLLYFIHERALCPMADLVLCISRQDLDYYRGFMYPDQLRLLPFLYDDGVLAGVEPLRPGHPYICMVGSLRAYQNYAAAMFALEQVWPILFRENVGLHLYIVGELPGDGTPEYRRLKESVAASERVVLTGRVDSAIPVVKGALASLVPLSIGSGVRTKIIESAACGTPVVSTTIGAEGLPFVDGDSIFIADTAVQLAERVLQLQNDRSLRADMAQKAYIKYHDELSCEAGRRIIGEIFRGLSQPDGRPPGEVKADARTGGKV